MVPDGNAVGGRKQQRHRAEPDRLFDKEHLAMIREPRREPEKRLASRQFIPKKQSLLFRNSPTHSRTSTNRSSAATSAENSSTLHRVVRNRPERRLAYCVPVALRVKGIRQECKRSVPLCMP